jgi:hypothetical protein
MRKRTVERYTSWSRRDRIDRTSRSSECWSRTVFQADSDNLRHRGCPSENYNSQYASLGLADGADRVWVVTTLATWLIGEEACAFTRESISQYGHPVQEGYSALAGHHVPMKPWARNYILALSRLCRLHSSQNRLALFRASWIDPGRKTICPDSLAPGRK